jgi:class 3 adenylate cyclase
MPQIRLSSLDRHININLDIDKTSSQQTVIDLDLDQNGFSALPVRIPAGTVTLVIHSHLPQDAGLTVLGINRPLFYELMEKFPMIKHPYFTAKKLLNHQSFRDLFRIQELNPSLRLNLNSLTLVFTDLKGSTDMYSRVGDTSAYDAVRDHFSILFDVVRKHNGAVVKTMGDAIMATFNTPAEGFRCAVDMVSAVKEWNDTRQGQETLGLKVGVHEGSSIAVNNDDRVDFFGQTVNIAARVQGLAEAGEVWYTESIAKESGVQDLLHLHQMKPEKQEAHLKGVSGAMTVYKLVA